MINTFVKKKILILLTIITLNNCTANTNSNFNNNVMKNHSDFSYKNNYVICGS